MADKIDENKIYNLFNLRDQLFDNVGEAKKEEPKGDNNILNIHGNYHHDYSQQGLNGADITYGYLNKEDDNNIILINNIKVIDNNTLELNRVYLNKNFYNKEPYDTERLIIKRNSHASLIGKRDDKFKKVGTLISTDGNFTSSIRFKHFRNPNEILFNQNVFYYKSIIDTYKIYKILNKVPSKKECDIKKLFYYEYIKNLI
jgi:hypothetical protein